MIVFNVLFFHPKSLGMCMYDNEAVKCKECKRCPNNKFKIKFFLKDLRRQLTW